MESYTPGQSVIAPPRLEARGEASIPQNALLLLLRMADALLTHDEILDANVVTLRLPHPMDDLRLELLTDQLASAMAGKLDRLWVLDLTPVTYLGSSMLGFLVNLRHQIKAGQGRLVLCGMSPVLMDLFRNCSMERLFVIAKDRAAALR